VACPLTDDLGGELAASQHALEGRVASDVRDANGQRDLLVFRTTRLAPAVPAFGDVIEKSPHGPRQTKSVAEHVCHLAWERALE
jgi:hypothetical protein